MRHVLHFPLILSLLSAVDAGAVPALDCASIAYTSDADDPNPLPPILFPISPGKNFEIYVMNVDGSGKTRLTNGVGNDGFLAWSPDGQRIAFESSRAGNGILVDYDIYVMNADGSVVTRLTDSPAFDAVPSWSPDGERIAFTSFRDGDPEIYVMNADGSGETRITHSAGWDFAFGNWSKGADPLDPSDDRIVFHSDRDGAGPPAGLLPLRTFDIYVMKPDGSNVTRLTYDTAVNDHEPAWSPDGQRIAFVSNRDDGGGDPSCGPAGCGEIYVMNADGSAQTRLTFGMADARHPSWSPDGEQIVFDGNHDGDYEIYVMNADGGAIAPVTQNAAYDFRAVFRPQCE